MKTQACPREDELLDALASAWVGPELSAHVAECASCGELRLVAGALLEERKEAIAEAPVPSAGTMWWRMQMRQRREAQALARRSLLIGQLATFAVALILLATLAGSDVFIGVRDLIATIRVSNTLLLIALSAALAAPIAGWVAIRQK